ncbi:MAG: pantoate--beta-alanine ligase [Beijerinckiaceae bacterium]|nr:pantoate--beta-alanine ligase [Beijerinckiaceae bacterium]
MSQIAVLKTVRDLRGQVAHWRRGGETIALVPTMGALHAGHVSLARRAQSRADRCIVSIFVNPTQFGPGEDFQSYPRSLSADLERLQAIGVDAVFTPDAAQMYPEGFSTAISLKGPAEAGLEDRFRPTHFSGVATVVAKLLIQSMPDLAVFGEKDFQQLAVIRRLARDLDLPTEIEGAPTLREADGLAMSSRNVYLSAQERATAPLLQRVLAEAAGAIAAGGEPGAAIERGCETIEQGGFALDYLEFRDAATLGPAQRGRPARLLVAARLGRTRLIDNIAVSFGGGDEP